MQISHVTIQNFRNIQKMDVSLGKLVVVVGENNSGKSNFLKAVTLPFLAEENGYIGKSLSWTDINSNARKAYYKFLIDQKDLIVSGKLSIEDFLKQLPVVSVEVQLLPESDEKYYVKDFGCDIELDDIAYRIKYEFKPKRVADIFSVVKNILQDEEVNENNIKKVQLSLLPVDFYEYSIFVPNKESIPYETLKQFRYMLLAAERDEFSTSNERIGSKSLVKLLQMKLEDSEKIKVEKNYSEFFDELKKLSGMEKIINWQNDSNIENAKEFFKRISILPNMPPMSSILNSVRLGYDDESLSLQGLGQRNMILLLVLINSFKEKSEEIGLRVIAIEEPEAHLCINNIKLVSSFISTFADKNPKVQIFCTTHSTEIINKFQFENIIIMNEGKGVALRDELDKSAMDYLSKIPNLDLYKLFYARKCILVEGLTEELLIRAYLEGKKQLSDIEVLAFHKGYRSIIEIWNKINETSNRKLGIVRDNDNQEQAKKDHEKLANERICIKTTTGYTLESDIVNAGDNCTLLKEKYGNDMGWQNMTCDQLQEDWRKSKSYVMLKICQDLRNGKLEAFVLPKHIQEVISFMGNEADLDEN